MTSVTVWVLVCLSAAWLVSTDIRKYTNEWVAEIKGGVDVARKAVKNLGYVFVGPAGFDNFYVLRRDDLPKYSEMSRKKSLNLTGRLDALPEVLWAEQQKIVRRSKRDFILDKGKTSEERYLEVKVELQTGPKRVVRRTRTRNYDTTSKTTTKSVDPVGETSESIPVTTQVPLPNQSTVRKINNLNTFPKETPGSFNKAENTNTGLKVNNLKQPVKEQQPNTHTIKPKVLQPNTQPTDLKRNNLNGLQKSNAQSLNQVKPTSTNNGSTLNKTRQPVQQTQQNTTLTTESVISYKKPTVVKRNIVNVSPKGHINRLKHGNKKNPKTGFTFNNLKKPVQSHQNTNLKNKQKPVQVNAPFNKQSALKPAVVNEKAPASNPQKIGITTTQAMTTNNKASTSTSVNKSTQWSKSTILTTQSTTTSISSFSTKPSNSSALSTYTGPTPSIELLSKKVSAYRTMYSDPLWGKQWYFHDYRTKNTAVMDFNIVPVWKQGITGKGITVAVVDDGVQNGHPDLLGNFDFSMSYDLLKGISGSDPEKGDFHGTMCAGEIAMVANNKKCGVGVAYNSKIIGIKVLGTSTTDFMEAKAFTYRLDKVDVYSNSWGPTDDGITMEKIDRMTLLAFKKGITAGRGGKGSIYVFAAGNGKHESDNCAADGMINSPYTIPIASVSQRGKTVYYSERCTGVFAAAYSGGNDEDELVTTVDLNGACTTEFTGTSAATPLASGIIALVLNANTNLTERDIKHIITMGAEVAPVANNPGSWYKNGRGFWVSNDFGFGLLNVENMVDLARNWVTVPRKSECVVAINLKNPVYFEPGQTRPVKFSTRACQNTTDAVNYLEQIEVSSRVQYSYRGALSIDITSPSGTKSALLEIRPKDNSTDGLSDWTIKSVHNWGEDPKGIWEISVRANNITDATEASGYVQNFTVIFHGTFERPAHYSKGSRSYSAFRLPSGKTSAE